MTNSALAQTDSLGKTCLHHAALAGDTALMSYLLKRGLALDQKDKNGWPPLHDAVQKKETSSVRFLIAHHADIHAQTSDLNTPLHLAVLNDDMDSAEMFFFHGAYSDISTENSDKVSPLSCAVQKRCYALAELLYCPLHSLIKRNRTLYYEDLLSKEQEEEES